MIKRLLPSVLFAAVAMSLVAAQSASPKKPRPFEYLDVGPVRIEAIVDSPRVALNLHSIQEQLGHAEIRKKPDTEGDAESFPYVCYRGGSGTNQFLLIVDSDEDMGGPELDVMGMTVARPFAAPDYAERCAVLRDPTWTPMTDRGVRLGMARREVESILGGRRRGGNKVTYEVDEERPNPSNPSCDPLTVQSELNLLYKNERLVSFKGLRFDFC